MRLLPQALRLLACALIGSLVLPALACLAVEEARSVRVVDGDTLVLVDGRRLRLPGIDAPETGPTPEPFAAQARERLRELVEGRPLTLRTVDPGRDRHGRVLAVVSTAEVPDIGHLLVEEGLATVWFRTDQPHGGRYMQAERAARQARKGLWSAVAVYENKPPAGKLVTVEPGRVDRLRRAGRHLFLDFGVDRAGNESFTVVIYEDVAALFERPIADLKGRPIRVTGRLESGPRGHLEIKLLHPSRLEILPLD